MSDLFVTYHYTGRMGFEDSVLVQGYGNLVINDRITPQSDVGIETLTNETIEHAKKEFGLATCFTEILWWSKLG